FVNTLVLRTNLAGDPSFSELLRRARESTLGAFDHQDAPFEKLVEKLAPRRKVGQTPLFQVVLALQNAPLGPLALPGLQMDLMDVDLSAAKFDLTLAVIERERDLAAWLEYDLDLFDPATAERIARHLRVPLAG